MAASTVKSGYNCLLKKSSTAYAEVVDISPPKVSRNYIEVTHLTSDNQNREYVAGLKETEPFDVTLNWLPGDTTQDDFLTDMYAGTLSTYSVVFEGATDYTWTFSAYISGLAPQTLDNENPQRAVVTFRPNTIITQT